LGLVGPYAALVAALLAVLVAWAVATWRARETGRLAAWVAGIEAGENSPVAEPDGLARPLLDLARLARRERARLAEQGRLLDAVIEALPDPVLLVDGERRILRANAAARQGFACAAGQSLLAAIRDPGVLAAVSAALDAGSASGVAFSPTVARQRQFAARIEPVRLPDGGRGALMALREQSEQLQIERMRSDFVANASHEIRTPLAAIAGLIETLRGPARDDAAARERFLATMAAEAARMARLVDDLLTLSRIEQAAGQPPTARCDLAAVLAAVIDRLAPMAARHRVRLELEVTRPLPLALGDADQLHQLFLNLIDNAIKYGGDGKAVTVELEPLATAPTDAGPTSGRPCLRACVIDQGEGIAKEHIPRLTERFYRVDKARSRGQGGTGLGLAIAKHIVRRHQGHLQISSEPGRGSRFCVFLPTAVGPEVEVPRR
jgi:two-component system phosphate regulon sensor histidine kinase PhoR